VGKAGYPIAGMSKTDLFITSQSEAGSSSLHPYGAWLWISWGTGFVTSEGSDVRPESRLGRHCQRWKPNCPRMDAQVGRNKMIQA
jgi:hypothetical protein